MGSTRFFLMGRGSGITFFLWVGGSEKNSNSWLMGSLSNQELIYSSCTRIEKNS